MPKLSNDSEMLIQSIRNAETSARYFTDECWVLGIPHPILSRPLELKRMGTIPYSPHFIAEETKALGSRN